MRNALVLLLTVLALGCGSDEKKSAAEPPSRGEGSALFAATTILTEAAAPSAFRAQVVATAPTTLACRMGVQQGEGTMRWASRWAVVTATNGSLTIPLSDSAGQEALSRCGPGLSLVVQCRGTGPERWVRGEQRFTQPLPLQPPSLIPDAGGYFASLPSGGVLGWLLLEPRLGVTARQVPQWVELADGDAVVSLPRPAPGLSLHVWWASRGVPCLRGGDCDDSSWAEAMLWLRHTEVPHESESRLAPSSH